jgi:cold shock CspA family protein
MPYNYFERRVRSAPTLVTVMTERIPPDREIAHFIATIVAARLTPIGEIQQMIASLSETVEKLRNGKSEAAPAAAPAPRRRKAAVAIDASAPKRGRGRPRKSAPPVEERVRRPEPVMVAPVAPRLMRRAEVAPAEPFGGQATILQNSGPQKTVLRGVVRWFDLRTRQGALRLPGFAEDITIEASTLESAGISRLYKGQEVEATVSGENGSARLLSVALPGRAADPAKGLFATGSARRHSKPVVVEMKHDAMRRAAARVEAEHVLGSNGRRSV